MGIDKTVKIGFLTASVSRSAGGLYDAMRHLALGLSGQSKLAVQIFGVRDNNTAADLSGWGSLSVHVFKRKGPGFFGYTSQLQNALQIGDLDIVHTQGLWMYPSLASSQWAKKSEKPYLISPHGMLDLWAVRNSYWKKRLAGLLFEDAHLRGAACLHALCEAEANAIRAYGLKNPICIIPNGILSAPSQVVIETPDWRQHLPKNAKILLYLGRLHPKKGVLQLLEAWARVDTKQDSEEWHLVIAGWDQGGHEQVLKAKVENLGLKARVHFIGAQFGEQKHACYCHADAFILPSFSEGLPMTVLEAWSYGLPVLMTPQCNLPEGFQANAAIQIETEVRIIESGLIQLFAMDDIARRAMGERGKVLTNQRFNWEHIAEQMTSVYQWVLGQASKPDCVRLD